jgi:DnaK suppressor protein
MAARMMKNEDLAQFRERLTAMEVELREINASAAHELKPVALDQTSVGRVSRVDAMQLQQMSQETARRRQQLLLKIEGALRRIESGRFGLCFLCETEIDLRRLGVDPTITRCRDCVEGA